MSVQISRMQFLRGDFRGRETPLRPPWAIEENLFLQACNRCGDCISQCPTHIIQQGRARYPVIDFNQGECLFCDRCIDSCKSGALLKTFNPPWSITAEIDENSCLPHHGVECRSCYDPCEARAIKMPPRLGGISVPLVDAHRCSGCGACIAICPVNAISMNTTDSKVTQ